MFAVALVLTYTAIFGLSATIGWTRTWRAVGVDSMFPPFADLRTLTGASITVAHGIDPLRQNPGDPWGRPLNYPRVWIPIVRTLRLTPATTPIFGGAVAALFIASLIWAAYALTDARSDRALLYRGSADSGRALRSRTRKYRSAHVRSCRRLIDARKDVDSACRAGGGIDA